MIQQMKPAPDFESINNEGAKVKLSDFRGVPVVLYFYPKDDTPGCTTEACGFRDDYSQYKELSAEIIGVSPDDVNSHTKFIDKHTLPFTLLADEDHNVSKLYGVWVLKKRFGREYYGVQRTTFLIDKEGIVAKIFKGVKPAGHSSEVLEAIKGLKN